MVFFDCIEWNFVLCVIISCSVNCSSCARHSKMTTEKEFSMVYMVANDSSPSSGCDDSPDRSSDSNLCNISQSSREEDSQSITANSNIETRMKEAKCVARPVRSYNKWSPTQEGATLVWRDVCVYANSENRTPIKRIINNSTGAIQAGTLMALMGSR